MYAAFSSAVLTSSNAEAKVVVDAVPFEANATLKNEAAIKDNIMLCVRSKGTSFVEKAKRAAQSGAVAVIVVNTDDSLVKMSALGDDTGYTSNIPVLMINSVDATRLHEHGAALIRGSFFLQGILGGSFC